jgi:hypothetical protein
MLRTTNDGRKQVILFLITTPDGKATQYTDRNRAEFEAEKRGTTVTEIVKKLPTPQPATSAIADEIAKAKAQAKSDAEYVERISKKRRERLLETTPTPTLAHATTTPGPMPEIAPQPPLPRQEDAFPKATGPRPSDLWRRFRPELKQMRKDLKAQQFNEDWWDDQDNVEFYRTCWLNAHNRNAPDEDKAQAKAMLKEIGFIPIGMTIMSFGTIQVSGDEAKAGNYRIRKQVGRDTFQVECYGHTFDEIGLARGGLRYLDLMVAEFPQHMRTDYLEPDDVVWHCSEHFGATGPGPRAKFTKVRAGDLMTAAAKVVCTDNPEHQVTYFKPNALFGEFGLRLKLWHARPEVQQRLAGATYRDTGRRAMQHPDGTVMYDMIDGVRTAATKNAWEEVVTYPDHDEWADLGRRAANPTADNLVSTWHNEKAQATWIATEKKPSDSDVRYRFPPENKPVGRRDPKTGESLPNAPLSKEAWKKYLGHLYRDFLGKHETELKTYNGFAKGRHVKGETTLEDDWPECSVAEWFNPAKVIDHNFAQPWTTTPPPVTLGEKLAWQRALELVDAYDQVGVVDFDSEFKEDLLGEANTDETATSPRHVGGVPPGPVAGDGRPAEAPAG